MDWNWNIWEINNTSKRKNKRKLHKKKRNRKKDRKFRVLWPIVTYESKKEYFNDGSVEHGPWIKKMLKNKKIIFLLYIYKYSTYEFKEYVKSTNKFIDIGLLKN